MRFRFVTTLFAALLALASSGAAASAEIIAGRVVAIADGDTLTILNGSLREHRVRLAGIDAPEKAQPFGSRAKQKLAQLCAGKAAEATVETVDRYGRSVAYVRCDGVEANLQMLQEGLAWAYIRFNPPAAYLQAEQQARAARRGLWADANPVPPWEWRRR